MGRTLDVKVNPRQRKKQEINLELIPLKNIRTFLGFNLATNVDYLNMILS